MVKPIGVFSRNLFQQDGWRLRARLQDKLTRSLEQSTVNDEQVILPYFPDLLKLSQ